ncbi:MAG: hypothetical protein RBS28_02850 [Rhodocyclaceae bacterium]|nr:hypothetical protein [Rhodocyclaceae bacterium]
MNTRVMPSRLLLEGTMLMLAVLVWPGIRPFHRATWIMEVAPVVIALPVLWLTCRRYPRHR